MELRTFGRQESRKSEGRVFWRAKRGAEDSTSLCEIFLEPEFGNEKQWVMMFSHIQER
jgi:hypothetical protein